MGNAIKMEAAKVGAKNKQSLKSQSQGILMLLTQRKSD